jgi:16S rRNA (guanine527-N7)-methyltransferase
VSFLRTAIRELHLEAQVESKRIEGLAPDQAPDVLTARALAPLPQLLQLCAPLLSRPARALFHKGREYGQELRGAADQWRFDVLEHPSDTDPESVILEITNVSLQQ